MASRVKGQNAYRGLEVVAWGTCLSYFFHAALDKAVRYAIIKMWKPRTVATSNA